MDNTSDPSSGGAGGPFDGFREMPKANIDTHQMSVIIHSKEADGSPHCYSKAVYNLGEPLKIEEWAIQQSGDTKHPVDMEQLLRGTTKHLIVNYDPNHPGASLRSIAHSDLFQTNGISCPDGWGHTEESRRDGLYFPNKSEWAEYTV